MFEYKVDNITIYNTSAFDITPENKENIEKKIACWIVENLEQNILEEIIDKNYEGFCLAEKANIMEMALNILEKSKTGRKKYIENRLKEYFSAEYLINIPGFVRFRLKEYRNELENIIDSVIEKYLCEKEYYEFIELIKEYIKYQGSAIPMLHILTGKDGVRYFDKRGSEITKRLEEEYSFETDLSDDDKLLTILVLSAPKKIVWHNCELSKNNQLKSTLREIFGSSLVLCQGCSICRKNI